MKTTREVRAFFLFASLALRLGSSMLSVLPGRRLKGERMDMLVWATAGASDPTKASLPLHLVANGCVEVGHDSALVLAGDGADLITGDTIETMEGVGIPPVRDLVAKLKEHSVPVYV